MRPFIVRFDSSFTSCHCPKRQCLQPFRVGASASQQPVAGKARATRAMPPKQQRLLSLLHMLRTTLDAIFYEITGEGDVDVSMVPSMVPSILYTLYSILYTLYSILYTLYPKGDGRAPLQQVDVSMVPSGRHVYTPYSILYTLCSKGEGRAPLKKVDVSIVPSERHDYTPYSILYTVYSKGDGKAPLQQVDVTMVPSGRHVSLTRSITHSFTHSLTPSLAQ